MANLSLIKLTIIGAQLQETILILKKLNVAIGITSLIKFLIPLLNT